MWRVITWTKHNTSTMPVSMKHFASSPFMVNGSWSSTVYKSEENLRGKQCCMMRFNDFKKYLNKGKHQNRSSGHDKAV